MHASVTKGSCRSGILHACAWWRVSPTPKMLLNVGQWGIQGWLAKSTRVFEFVGCHWGKLWFHCDPPVFILWRGPKEFLLTNVGWWNENIGQNTTLGN